MTVFQLQFDEQEILELASRYVYPKEPDIVERVAPAARKRGYLSKGEFLEICEWKTPRSKPRCRENRVAFIKEVTHIALSTSNEELKIRILLLLSGVSWPTASVILHFCDRGRYPILDYRALWSLGVDPPPVYDFPFWSKYSVFVRGLANRTGHSMRVIDKALWQYSKENQKNRAA
jgi:hypothetical protein